MNVDEQVATKEDLRQMLTDFWVGLMGSSQAESVERLKASEMLAKYILGEGNTPIKRRGGGRPTTADVLKRVQELEERE